MDLADAAVVVMGERSPGVTSCTVDRKDFRVDRREDRHAIDVVAPPGG
jgi:hypothetical protein